MGVAGVVVVDHTADVCGVVPEVAETLRVVERLCVVEMDAIAQPSSHQCEALSDVLRVGVHKGKRGNEAQLVAMISTASPATGKAIKLRFFCSSLTA